jgi:hypothetical protein
VCVVKRLQQRLFVCRVPSLFAEGLAARHAEVCLEGAATLAGMGLDESSRSRTRCRFVRCLPG